MVLYTCWHNLAWCSIHADIIWRGALYTFTHKLKSSCGHGKSWVILTRWAHWCIHGNRVAKCARYCSSKYSQRDWSSCISDSADAPRWPSLSAVHTVSLVKNSLHISHKCCSFRYHPTWRATTTLTPSIHPPSNTLLQHHPHSTMALGLRGHSTQPHSNQTLQALDPHRWPVHIGYCHL